jgi:phage FluMu gp28-like protein
MTRNLKGARLGGDAFLLPYQQAWVKDASPLRIMEKSRQVGMTFADAYDSVRKAACAGGRFDVWISSRDERQARLYLEDCARWARILSIPSFYAGYEPVGDSGSGGAHWLEFGTGRRIYSLSSNPNALAGKRGHVKLDEFALHEDQRLLYQVAKPVTMWGGQLSIFSTHRGADTLFNQLLRDIRERSNPMGWSLHRVRLVDAARQGLVSRINFKTRRSESPGGFVARLRRECVTEEQWLQEYCCVPADESSAFLGYGLINGCEAEDCLRSFEWLEQAAHPLYIGVDVARKHDLCVVDVGEKIGDVVWDRLRVELKDCTFAEMEHELFRLLALPGVKRACVDATGMGAQLAERASERFGWKVEPLVFTAPLKEELACTLRADFEARRLRLPKSDHRLVADLRGIRKQVTSAGNLRFAGESPDSHCDRFWAKALRQYAARRSEGFGGLVA